MADFNLSLLYHKDILQILDGDISFPNCDGISYKFSYLKAYEISELFDELNLKSTVESGCSRWMIMENLVKQSIESGCFDRLITLIFSKIDYTEYRVRISDDNYVELVQDTLLGFVNSKWVSAGISIKRDGSGFHLIAGKSGILLSDNAPKTYDSEYIRGLLERCISDIESGCMDGALVKSRTILEELCIQILEKHGGVNRDYRGNLGDMFDDVRVRLNMKRSDVPPPVKGIDKSLVKIISDVGEIRDKYSEAHTKGRVRITLSKSETLLAVNATIAVCEYLLSISDTSSLDERVHSRDDSGVKNSLNSQ